MAGAASPGSPSTVALTCNVLFGWSAGLWTAAMVTAPVLLTVPAAMVKALPFCTKSPGTAGASGVAVTVTTTGTPGGLLSAADTTAAPPSSSILAAERSSVTSGAGSSSVMVMVCTDGTAAAPPVTAANTRSVRLPA